MRFIDEYRDAELGKKLVSRIEQLSTRPARLMEFCGGDTVAIMHARLRLLSLESGRLEHIAVAPLPFLAIHRL